MDWSIKPLGSVASFIGGGTPSKARPEYWGGNIPWVSPKDMKSDIVFDSQDRITPDAIQESATKRIPKGSVLVVVRSGILARTIPIAIAGRELTINQDLKAIVPKEQINYEFLAYFLRASETQLLGLVTRGATVHRLTTDVLKALLIPLPPLEEQRRAVAFLDATFAGLAEVRTRIEANLEDVNYLRQSLLQRAFAGELT